MAELKELTEFYARAAAMKDPVFKLDGRVVGGGPSNLSDMSKWTVEERQPDFQCLIDSGIDCEFSDNRDNWVIGKLSEVMADKVLPYSDGSTVFKYCRPRLNHVHAWIATEDSKCPLPDGYLVEIFIGSNRSDPRDPSIVNWNSRTCAPINAFVVLPK